jgi:hypothetical protein
MPSAHTRRRQTNRDINLSGGAPPGGQTTATVARGRARSLARTNSRARTGGMTSLPTPVGIQHFALSRKDGKTITVNPDQFILGYVQWLQTVGACSKEDQLLAFNTGIQYVNNLGGMASI